MDDIDYSMQQIQQDLLQTHPFGERERAVIVLTLQTHFPLL